MEKNSLTIPVAIILAGALIGGAVIFTNKGGAAPAAVVQNAGAVPAAVAPELALQPVDANDHIVGNPGAPVVVVEYSDTQCPFCRLFHTTMQTLMDSFGAEGKMAWVYRHFPLTTLHPQARPEAAATECVATLGGNDAFWKFTNSLYEKRGNNEEIAATDLTALATAAGVDGGAFDACVSSGSTFAAVDADAEHAQSLGARGTPYSVIVLQKEASQDLKDFVAFNNAEILKQQRPGSSDILGVSKDGKRIFVSGAMPLEMMQAILEYALK